MYQFEKPGDTGIAIPTDAVDMGDSYSMEYPPSTAQKPYPFELPGE